MVDMNDSSSWAQGSKCYEQLKVVDLMNCSKSRAHNTLCYEQLKLVDGMNNSRSHELKALDTMNRSGLCMT